MKTVSDASLWWIAACRDCGLEVTIPTNDGFCAKTGKPHDFERVQRPRPSELDSSNAPHTRCDQCGGTLFANCFVTSTVGGVRKVYCSTACADAPGSSDAVPPMNRCGYSTDRLGQCVRLDCHTGDHDYELSDERIGRRSNDAPPVHPDDARTPVIVRGTQLGRPNQSGQIYVEFGERPYLHWAWVDASAVCTQEAPPNYPEAAPTHRCCVCKKVNRGDEVAIWGDFATCSNDCSDTYLSICSTQGRALRALQAKVKKLTAARSQEAPSYETDPAQLEHARACKQIKRWSERMGCAAPEAFEQAVWLCAKELTANYQERRTDKASPVPTFEEAWTVEQKRVGYQYGEEALSNVKLGWEIRGLHPQPEDSARISELEHELRILQEDATNRINAYERLKDSQISVEEHRRLLNEEASNVRTNTIKECARYIDSWVEANDPRDQDYVCYSNVVRRMLAPEQNNELKCYNMADIRNWLQEIMSGDGIGEHVHTGHKNAATLLLDLIDGDLPYPKKR